jgi:hypothetical protein
MAWKDPDTDDSDKEWSDATGDKWREEAEEGHITSGEKKKLTDEEEAFQEDRCEACGDLMPEDDFLILQMIVRGQEAEGMAEKLTKPLPEIEARIIAIQCFIREQLECSEKELPDLMDEVSRHGHLLRCGNQECEAIIQKIDCFCFLCGTRNLNFNIRYFWLVNGLALSEARAQECKKEHPQQKEGCVPHCEFCGIEIHPATPTSPD